MMSLQILKRHYNKWLLFVTLFTIHNFAYATQTEVADRKLSFDDITKGDSASRVIGGTFVPVGAYPWFARATIGNNPDRWAGCGGSLVSPSFVLTAAHCIFKKFNESGGYVVGSRCYGSGDPNNNNCGQSPSEYREVSWVWVDPDYNKRLDDYDYALVRLSAPITNIKPVAMNTKSDLPKGGDDVIGMGFGDTTNKGNGKPSLKLLHVELDALSDAECGKLWKPDPITAQMVCAARKGVDTCSGDSGGALITKTKPYQLLGINSFGGNKCADLKAPGVNARVSTRYEVLKEVICDNTPASHPKADFCGGGTTPAPAPNPPTSKAPTTTGPFDCPDNDVGCPNITTRFKVEWLTDKFADIDNSWFIKQGRQKILSIKRKSVEINKQYEWCLCMPRGKYKFALADKDGDGFKSGYFKIFWNKKLVVNLTSRGNFSKKKRL